LTTPAAVPDFRISRLGDARHPSPLAVPEAGTFVGDEERVFLDPRLGRVRETLGPDGEPATFELAGPRERLHFEPSAVRAAVVTCGGLCPGLNDVVRALVVELRSRYRVADVLGARYGYSGLARDARLLSLDLAAVEDIHLRGGSMLGTCRGTPPVGEIVDTLVRDRIDLFFPVGGDGALRGALEIAEEIARRGLDIAVVGLPKTIDNDIPWVRRSFGFQTAVRVASEAVRAAHVEATAVRRGVGLVRLMGRNTGFLAATATLAAGVVDFCLIPECRFALEGEDGLLRLVERAVDDKGHALLVVAEGAGQEFFAGQNLGRDASGNRKLGDIGAWLRQRLEEYFAARGGIGMKYLDPSYLVRSAAADTSDSMHASRLAQNAVHAAMSGRTAMLVGYWHGVMTHVPLTALRGRNRPVDPRGELWWNVLESTGQPARIGALQTTDA
jgi:6-phosphofructokinase 1